MSFRHIIWYVVTFTSICRVCLPLFWILHVSWIHICTLHSWFAFLTPIHYFCMVTHACVYVFFQYAWYGVNITCGISVYPCARERERGRERQRKRKKKRGRHERHNPYLAATVLKNLRVFQILPLWPLVVSLISRKDSIWIHLRGSVKISQLPKKVCHRAFAWTWSSESPSRWGSPARGARVVAADIMGASQSQDCRVTLSGLDNASEAHVWFWGTKTSTNIEWVAGRYGEVWILIKT